MERLVGQQPPYHCDVFVLTHHPRAPVTMEGGTTFYFVTDGIQVALERAKKAANGKDIRIGGGASTIRQYLQAGLVDEMHLAIAPKLLGSGEHLLIGIDLPKLGYHVSEYAPTPAATHIVVTKRT
jgi:dihydrofolate reductase